MQYVRLHTDADGESHFEDVEVYLEAKDFAPPAPPLLLSTFAPASRVGFMAGPTGWRGGWHPTPRRQFLVCLSGIGNFQASDGEIRSLRPGDVILLEDGAGKGHVSWAEADQGAAFLVAQVPD
jgi:quercetin dioxygenase-like cupin family protein